MAQVSPKLQAAIQAALQPKLMENAWTADENDTTLAEYVTMMIVNGKDQEGVKQELSSDLLGCPEDDPLVAEFAVWLFDTVNRLHAEHQAAENPDQQQQQGGEQTQSIPTVQDSQMEDTSGPAPYVHPFCSSHISKKGAKAQYYYNPSHQMMPYNMATYRQMQYEQQLMLNRNRPTGPKSMRNGTNPRGRGGRMLGQMNRQMDRQNELPDNLRKIRGAAGGQAGRINAHAGRDGAPRGPRNSNVANGVQRMMNGGRGGHGGNMNGMNMMNGGNFNPGQQMQFMQMMEASAQMMAQVLQQNGGLNMNGGFQQRGGHRGGRGGRGGQRGGASAPSKQLHAVDGKLPDAALTGSNQDSSMEVDSGDASDKFSTMCRFNLSCTIPTCPFAHQSPAAPPNTSVDLSDTCAHGVACTNHKCSARHPSPAQKNSHQQDVECKYYPNCTNPRCPFRHPTEKPCKFGDACSNANCKFAHPKIMCRYNPCLNPGCQFKHADGQKRGKFEDKVWTAEGGEQQGEGGKAERFADFSNQGDGNEELIIPGQQQQQQQQDGQNGEAQDGAASQAMETQLAT